MATVVIAEKPSVARDIAAALGVKQRRQGYFEGEGWQITWAVGHLVALAQPEQMNPRWKKWSKATLPLLPAEWPLVVLPGTKEQFSIIVSLLNNPATSLVVCATDAGREGELIFRYIYAQAGCTLPVQRLWISSLTPAAIRQGFASLKSSTHYDALADSAIGRSRADWLVGMNLSRAYTLASDKLFSIGRVQTPTLAMLVAREEEIRDFKPESYSEVSAQFKLPQEKTPFKGLFYRPDEKTYPNNAKNFSYSPSQSRLESNPKLLAAIKARAQAGKAKVEAIRQREFNQAPPLLYDLTQLQKDANLVYGLSAQDTLSAAQDLYEKEKLISYPRSDCPYLDESTAASIQALLPKLVEQYRSHIGEQKIASTLPKRCVDTSKVVEHHAIIPLAVKRKPLNQNLERVFDLICRRMVMALLPDYSSSMTTVITAISSGTPTDTTVDYYQSLAKQLLTLGWKCVDLRHRKGANKEEKDSIPASVRKGVEVEASKVSISNKSTKPPPYLSEARLLAGMETAGESLNDKELSAAIRQKGLGTPATRAQIIEVLIKRGFVVRDGKNLRPTEMGMELIARVHPEVKSPKMTAEWEAALARISQGKESLADFMKKITEHISELIPKVLPPERALPVAARKAAIQAPARKAVASLPTAKLEMGEVLRQQFRLEHFRPLQEAICTHVASGGHALVVMPTGAGKSLCYQLPALMRPGCALIISPLISLMEDQVTKLRQLNLRAGYIHSGCPREESREMCRAYLEGHLDFLFIAPERLGLPGFLQVLARGRPALIAIDEAHCISQWGHDFRADYRQLGERLRCFAGVPIIALTATADVPVQDDIIAQLGLSSCTSFIGGFRRSNLAIEVLSMASNERFSALCHLLSDPSHRPAIVYVATRKDAEKYAQQLQQRYRARAYHAGLDGATRSQVHGAFLAGALDVIVATVAFGMGIDKPDVRMVVHLALPSTMAAYYQEIGRAGRDGKNAKAILLYSLEDQRMLLFLYRKNYPECESLEAIWRSIPAQGAPYDFLVGTEEDKDFVNGVQKLLVHGGLGLSADKTVLRQADGWQKSYKQQKKLRLQQLQEMFSYADQHTICRMVVVVRYFGDAKDGETPCGICDVCAPEAAYFKKVRSATARDRECLQGIIEVLGRKPSWSEGALFKVVSEAYRLSRDEFNSYLACLSAQGFITSEVATLKKNAHTIHYKLISLVEGITHLPERDLSLTAIMRLSRTPDQSPSVDS